MRTVEKVVQGLKKHIENAKVLEKRDSNFQKLLQERNFFRSNMLSLTQENECLQKTVSKLQTKVRNLEIDNNNYRTYLFKNREVESKHEYKHLGQTNEALNRITKESMLIKSFNGSNSNDTNKLKPRELGCRESRILIKQKFTATSTDKENQLKANWAMFKKKETFIESMHKAHLRAIRPMSNYTQGMENGLCVVKEGMTAYLPESNVKPKKRLKSCVQTRRVEKRPEVVRTALGTTLKKDKMVIGANNTLTFLLNEA